MTSTSSSSSVGLTKMCERRPSFQVSQWHLNRKKAELAKAEILQGCDAWVPSFHVIIKKSMNSFFSHQVSFNFWPPVEVTPAGEACLLV
jgi:hypothetical protein